MKFDGRSADAAWQTKPVVNDAGIAKGAPLTPWHKDRPTAGRAVVILAFAAGLLVAALGAPAADEPARPQPTAERAGTDSTFVEPTAKQLAPPSQPEISASDARTVDALYRLLIGPQPATSSSSGSNARLRAAPNNDAAGSVGRWASPR